MSTTKTKTSSTSTNASCSELKTQLEDEKKSKKIMLIAFIVILVIILIIGIIWFIYWLTHRNGGGSGGNNGGISTYSTVPSAGKKFMISYNYCLADPGSGTSPTLVACDSSDNNQIWSVSSPGVVNASTGKYLLYNGTAASLNSASASCAASGSTCTWTLDSGKFYPSNSSSDCLVPSPTTAGKVSTSSTCFGVILVSP